MRKIIIAIIVLVVGLTAYFTYSVFDQWVERESFSQKPFLCDGHSCNVILIIPESLSARHMGIYGYERDTTPFIDEFFGKEGIVFENAWSNSNWTPPSFAALFTSQLPSDIFVEVWEDKLSDTIPTFIDILEKGGISKFAAHSNTIFPWGQVDYNLATQFKPEERLLGMDFELFPAATEWIQKQAQRDNKQPFFLLLQPFTPHAPYNPPEPYRYFFDAPSEYPGPINPKDLEVRTLSLFNQEENVEAEIQRARLQYDQSLRYLDSQIESFISQIPEEILCHTVFIFISDHGQAFLQHGSITHGWLLYEEEIHVPFLIKAPGVNPKRIKEPVTLLDIGPTILEILGFDIPETFQGTSLLPLLQGKELQLEERIVRAEVLHKFYENKEWPPIFEPWVRTEPLLSWQNRFIAVRKGEWKLFRREFYDSVSPTFELYNLERDYEEQDDLMPQWHSLAREEQLEVAPLFDELEVGLYEQ